MSINFFDMVIWWPRSLGHDVFIGPCGLISFHRILLENSQWAFLMLSWTSKEKSRKAFWKPFGRPTQENGRLISCSPIEKKRVYFVHWCMKILAKRKRGNKFPLEGKCIFGQLREKANEETNPKASRSSFGRARGMRKLPFEGNPPPINTPPHSSHLIHST